jgi:hypothetical protein
MNIRTIASCLLYIVLIIPVTASISCSSSINDTRGPSSVNLEEVQITDELLVKEESSCTEDTLCVKINWAEATDVFGEHSRHVRLAAEVNGEWKLLWEKHTTGALNMAGNSADVPLSEEEATWLSMADKIVLSATQIDAQEGSAEPRVLVSSRLLMTNPGGETPAMQITSGADLSDAMLAGAVLSGMDLAETSFPRANLQCADLSYANLNGAGVAGADFSGTDMSGAIWLDGQQCEDPSPDGCDLPVPGDDSSNKEQGTFITITNNCQTPLQGTQECSSGSHNPCYAVIDPGQSKAFYGYNSHFKKDWDIIIICDWTKSVELSSFRLKAQQPPELTSWININWFPESYTLRTAKQGEFMRVGTDIQEYVMTRLNGSHSQNTDWGVSVTSFTFPPSNLTGTPSSISGSVLLRWSAPVRQPDAPVKKYTIRIDGDMSQIRVIPRTSCATEEYLYTGLTPGKTYTFDVASNYGTPNGRWSNICWVTPN